MAAIALDRSDRTQAILTWAGPLIGGAFVVPAIILAFSWNRPGSLARRESMIALVTCLAVFIVLVPVILWAYAFGGGERVFFIGWGVTAASFTAMTVRGLVVSIRARVPEPAPTTGTGWRG